MEIAEDAPRFLMSLIGSVVLGASLLATACGDASRDSMMNETLVSNDKAALSSRVKTVSREVTIDPPKNVANRLAFELASAALPVIGLIAEVSAPTIDGLAVQATAVARTSNGVIVGYNFAGEPYRGAMDIIVDIPSTALEAAQKKPKILSQLAFLDSDVNAIVVDGETVYFTGASSREETTPAFLGKSSLSSGAFTNEGTRVELPSYAGVALALVDDLVLAGSGDQGGVSSFYADTLERIANASFADVRSIASNRQSSKSTGLNLTSAKGTYAVLSGRPGILRFIAAAGTPLSTVNVGGLSTAQARARVIVGKDVSVISLGTAGVKVICNKDGTELVTIPPLMKLGLAADRTPVNSVSTFGNLVFTANGEAGVGVYSLDKDEGAATGSKCKSRTLTPLGSLNFGTALSANEIAVKENNLYVADGLGGLKILTLDGIKLGGDEGLDD